MSWDAVISKLRCDGLEDPNARPLATRTWCGRPPSLATSFYLGTKLLGVRDYCTPCSPVAQTFAAKVWGQTSGAEIRVESRAVPKIL